jgi:integrase/recombinase XerC
MRIKKFKELIKEFLIFLEVEKNASAHTIRAYQADLKQLIDFWTRITSKEKEISHAFDQIIRRYLVSLFYKKIKKSTLARKISCLRSLQQYLKTHGIKLSVNFKSPRPEKKLPITLTVDEIFYLLDTVKPEELPSKFPYRDKAIFELMYATGIRCSELIGITMNTIDFEDKSIRILGKGKKERIVLFGSKAQASLEKYLEKERTAQCPNAECPTLFLNYRGAPLTPRSVQRIFEMFRSFLKIDRHLTPHKVRHSFATHLLQQGVDLRVIQELLGHKTINTTEIYTKVTSSELALMCDEKHPLNKLDHLVTDE